MTIQYLPTAQIIINSVSLIFGQNRESVRAGIASDFKAENEILNFGNLPDAIYYRRDVYENVGGGDNFFFLQYDKNDLLSEIEIHQCDKIIVLSATFGFDDELDDVAIKLERYAPITKQSDGEFFFKDLKLLIMDKRKMGSIGSTLGYFYCSSDVSHLG